MGTRARPKPKRLAAKLRQIREGLGLSQSEMLKRLGVEDDVSLKRMSDYELGVREPSLLTLLQYARAAGIHMEAIVDDELNLPDKLPGDVKHENIRRKYAARSKRK
jgi:transcriptional regulator with XRE-family HTH domain